MFAKMLYLYLANNAPLDRKINYHEFLKGLMLFWPKSDENQDREDAKQEHYKAWKAL